MTYLFHPEAETEFFESIDFYEECQTGLGLDFSLEVYSTIERIVLFPKAWPILEDGLRRCLTKRFPFGMIYIQNDEEIFVLAVMHLMRKPDYWKGRILSNK